MILAREVQGFCGVWYKTPTYPNLICYIYFFQAFTHWQCQQIRFLYVHCLTLSTLRDGMRALSLSAQSPPDPSAPKHLTSLHPLLVHHHQSALRTESTISFPPPRLPLQLTHSSLPFWDTLILKICVGEQVTPPQQPPVHHYCCWWWWWILHTPLCVTYSLLSYVNVFRDVTHSELQWCWSTKLIITV